MSGIKRWTSEEDKILVESYRKLGVEGVRRLLPGRSRVAILNRVYKMGVHGRKWTRSEDRIIRMFYPTHGVECCQAIMPWRSLPAIYLRANRLQVYRNQPGRIKPTPEFADAMRAAANQGWIVRWW